MNQPSESIVDELLALSQQLLDAIDGGDWDAYAELCDPSLTAYEPEAVGQLVRGMEFHRFYFDPKKRTDSATKQSSICSPDVRLMGEVAVVSYVRLTQRMLEDDGTTTTANEETRVWQFQEGRWQHVHFHRSKAGTINL
jgi:calcium/calmodulin-dependent protein kinase (CaM kinase) II